MDYGCIGEHLPHSFSRVIHEKIGDYDYILKELRPDEVGPFMEARAFRAVNVTIPYKQKVIPYLDQTDASAASIGAVNTVVNRGGRLYGYNTDLYGMEALIRKSNMELAGKKVLILGTGGTSRTACFAANRLGVKEVINVSRTPGGHAVSYEEAAFKHNDAEIIINTTPVGMFPHIFEQPIDLDLYPNVGAVLDAVYNPLQTQLTAQAKQKGINAATGLYMLVSQAVRAYEIFMDTLAPAGETDRIFHEIFTAKQNIVLIGMPGSGKTTIGRLLAEKLHRELIDTDELIVQEAGCTIPEIFLDHGEAYFRKIETSVIKKTASRSGCVIATGGGAVLNEENIAALKMNGKVYFLDRDISLLLPTEDRPLASSAEAIRKRYQERYQLYLAAADETVPDNDMPAMVAADIERRHSL